MKKLLALSLIILIASCSKSSRTTMDENAVPTYAQGWKAYISTINADCYASPSGNDANTPGTITAPKQHIQACINAVQSGQTVIAQPGTYFENINFLGKNITVASEFINSGDPNDITGTIIDGNHSGSVVTLTSGENNEAKLIGFTIQNGYQPAGYHGGGIFSPYATPTLQNLRITNNSAFRGAGIYVTAQILQSPAILENLYIENNTAVISGGGIHAGQGLYSINNIMLVNNTSGQGDGNNGGGLCLSNARLVNDTINKVYAFGNSSGFGGGISIDMQYMPSNTTINVINSLIANNTSLKTLALCGSTNGGAGIDIEVGGTVNTTVNIVNSTIVNNKAEGYHGGIGVYIQNGNTSSRVNIINTILWGNIRFWNDPTEAPNQISVRNGNGDLPTQARPLVITNSNIQGGQTGVVGGTTSTIPYNFTTSTWLAGNIDQDPLFVNAVPIPTPQGSENYSITANSPCAGVGVNSITIGGQNIVAPIDDIIFTARPMPLGTNVDVGAYEITQKMQIQPAPFTPRPGSVIINKPHKPVHL